MRIGLATGKVLVLGSKALTLGAAAFAFGGAAQGAILVNGSFEDGIAIDGSGIVTLATDDIVSLPGWTVLADGVDYVSDALWAASDGSRSVDLSALTRGGISQRISGFDVGQRYRLTFDISANPFDPAARPRDKRFVVTASGTTPTTFTYELTDANTATTMLYQTYSYDFLAISETQGISFQSLVQDEYGVVLDNVTLSVVPEAATWAMVIAGFGIVGAGARRRRLLRPVAA